MLLERDNQLVVLRTLLTQAGRGRGQLVLINGEPGVGKSALIQRAVADSAGIRVLFGVCDGAVPARLLGPITDIADALGPAVIDELRGPTNRLELFRRVRAALGAVPTVFVIEDLQWADEATLDLVRYLGRRLQDQPLLLAVTYREAGTAQDDALTAVLGELSTGSTTTRLTVPPLTAGAVHDWVARTNSPVDAQALFSRTRGNPFFVEEVLKTDGDELPTGVRDAVTARLVRLSEGSRVVLDAVAVTGPATIDLVLAAAGVPASALDECRRAGLLLWDGERVAFRHDLIREVVEGSLSAAARSMVAAGALEHLERRADTDHRRLATLAEIAGAGDAVLAHAPLAAQRASTLGAHNEARYHLRAAVHYRHRLSKAAQARLMADLSFECYLTEHPEEALECRQLSLELYRSEGDVIGIGQSLRWLSRICWMLGRTADARDFGAEAVQTLQAEPPGEELAMAYSNRSQLCMLAGDVSGATEWGQLAIELGTELGADDVLMHAQNNVGAAIGCAGQLTQGVEILEASLELALRRDAQEHVARSFNNLASICISNYSLQAAQEYLTAGIGYCAERDLDTWRLSLESEAVTADLAAGRWDAGVVRCKRILQQSSSDVVRVSALWVLGTIELRRGLPGAAAHLSDAHTLAIRLQDPQSRIPVASARAEAAWTHGEFAGARMEINRTWQLATETGQRWWLGELSWWSLLAGHRLPGLSTTSEPHQLMLTGKWRAAAGVWERLGNPFWRALCLAQSN
ncbi:MAG: AAA family ATPase, partial [Nakamurella sp.]